MKRKIRDENVRRRLRRVMRIRRRLEGTAERPRLSVYRTSVHMYAQLIDDRGGQTLVSASTMHKGVRDEVKGMNKTDAAEKVGTILAQRAKDKGIESCVFDRKGWPFHGRIAALAKGARDGGLQF